MTVLEEARAALVALRDMHGHWHPCGHGMWALDLATGDYIELGCSPVCVQSNAALERIEAELSITPETPHADHQLFNTDQRRENIRRDHWYPALAWSNLDPGRV